MRRPEGGDISLGRRKVACLRLEVRVIHAVANLNQSKAVELADAAAATPAAEIAYRESHHLQAS